MKLKLRLATWLAALTASAGLLTGCVERRFIIETNPPSAIVYDEKGLPMGASPADRTFIYYGKYRFTIIKDGFETLVVDEKVRAPWYEWPFIDFFSENVIPWTIRDIRIFKYQLQPKQVVPPEEVMNRADVLRNRGQTIGVPLNDQTPGPVSSAVMPTAP